jgi:hypothetical protein
VLFVVISNDLAWARENLADECGDDCYFSAGMTDGGGDDDDIGEYKSKPAKELGALVWRRVSIRHELGRN